MLSKSRTPRVNALLDYRFWRRANEPAAQSPPFRDKAKPRQGEERKRPIIPPGRRSSVFGLFDTVYGLAWFAGSALMGLFYDMSILGLVVFSITLQLAALPLFAIAAKAKH